MDRSRMHQVLDNLVENAVQASNLNGETVQIEVETGADAVMIHVMDRGSGFDPVAIKHALDPFYTTKPEGTGLGLSLAFEIVAAHGGRLVIAPRLGGGSTVSVVLPKTVQA